MIDGFLLNAMGDIPPYNIALLEGDCRTPASPIARIIDPSGVSGDFDEVAVYWPSGIVVDGLTMVYATGLDVSSVERLGLWTSSDRVIWTRHGVVMEGQGDEGEIGMSHVVHDPADGSAPFKMWYSTKYADGRATEIRYATSSEGYNWTRVGVCYAKQHADEAVAILVDYVCFDDAIGQWRMFMSGVESLSPVRINPVEARCGTAGGTFTRRVTLMEPAGVTRSLQSSPAAGARWIALDDLTDVAPGAVFVLGTVDGAKAQRAVVESINTSQKTAKLGDSITVPAPALQMRSLMLTRISPSFYYRDSAGVGRGLFTGFGAFDAGLCEYVFPVIETETGFEVDLRLSPPCRPFGPGNSRSFENVSPLRSGCKAGPIDIPWPLPELEAKSAE